MTLSHAVRIITFPVRNIAPIFNLKLFQLDSEKFLILIIFLCASIFAV